MCVFEGRRSSINIGSASVLNNHDSVLNRDGGVKYSTSILLKKAMKNSSRAHRKARQTVVL